MVWAQRRHPGVFWLLVLASTEHLQYEEELGGGSPIEEDVVQGQRRRLAAS